MNDNEKATYWVSAAVSNEEFSERDVEIASYELQTSQYLAELNRHPNICYFPHYYNPRYKRGL